MRILAYACVKTTQKACNKFSDSCDEFHRNVFHSTVVCCSSCQSTDNQVLPEGFSWIQHGSSTSKTDRQQHELLLSHTSRERLVRYFVLGSAILVHCRTPSCARHDYLSKFTKKLFLIKPTLPFLMRQLSFSWFILAVSANSASWLPH